MSELQSMFVVLPVTLFAFFLLSTFGLKADEQLRKHACSYHSIYYVCHALVLSACMIIPMV